MSINPHLQYLQQQQQQQQRGLTQSPPVSQLQLHQRQHILNQHLQQQQQQHQMPSGNPLLAALNGNASSQPPQAPGLSQNVAPGLSQNVNSLLQLQMQQNQSQNQPTQNLQNQQPVHPLQQQLQLQQAQAAQVQAQAQAQAQIQQHQQHQQKMPVVREVWANNLEVEFASLRRFANDLTSSVHVAIHQEIPGIVARPVGTFKSSSDYHFQTLRSNSDLLNLIQLSLCITKINYNEVSASVVWQFNFLYDILKEMYNEEHLSMLSQLAHINLQLHMAQGIPHFNFAELMIESGLLLDSNINWISYHSGYDLGFLISLLTNDTLPLDELDFYWWCTKYFPNFYDLKYIGSNFLSSSKTNNNSSLDNDSKANNKPSIEYLAEELHLLPISPVIRQYLTPPSSQFPALHQQMSSTMHAYLAMECYKELLKQTGYDTSVFAKYKGVLWGLGNGPEAVNQPYDGPATPGATIKGGVVHFGRAL